MLRKVNERVSFTTGPLDPLSSRDQGFPGFRGLAMLLASADPSSDIGYDGNYLQALMYFGREDLMQEHEVQQGAPCPAAGSGGDPLEAIAERAKTTSIVIVNESHVRSRDRAFVEDVARTLRPLGYDIYAAETFVAGGEWRIDAGPDRLPYLTHDSGAYIGETQFGRLGRTVIALGYDLVGYEDEPDGDWPEDVVDRINERDEGQAVNLMKAVFDEHPDAKILIHVGNTHAKEVPTLHEDGRTTRLLAYRLKQKTGIDPLTVEQKVCSNVDDYRLVEPREGFDLAVAQPPNDYIGKRPAWRQERGDRAVPIPEALMAEPGEWRIVEARPLGEPVEAVPMDMVAIRPGEDDVVLMLPPGAYEVRAVVLPYTPW